MNEILMTRITSDNYSILRGFQEFATERKRSTRSAVENVKYLSPQIWSLLPKAGRMPTTLQKLKVKN